MATPDIPNISAEEIAELRASARASRSGSRSGSRTAVEPTPLLKKQVRKAEREQTKPRKPASARAGRVSAPSGSAGAVVSFALRQVGKPYRFGADGPNAFDCSGLTQAAYAQAGIRLPHQSGAQRAYGRSISRSQLAAGDLVLYSGHVAIYVGRDRIVHAANPGKGVVVATMYGTPVGYRRLL